MKLRTLPLLALPLLTAACDDGGDAAPAPAASEKITAAPDLADKADGTLVARPQGRLLPGTTTVSLDAGPTSWRFNTFPGTRAKITVTSPDGDLDPVVVVRGPIPQDLQATVAWNDDRSPDEFTAEVEVTADATGAFEVVAGTYGQLQLGQATPGRLTVDFQCLAACELPQIPLATVLEQFGEPAVQGALGQVLPTLFPDPATAAAVEAQVSAFFAGDQDVFPVVTLAHLGAAQPLLELAAQAPAPPPEPVTFDLGELLTKRCTVERTTRSPLHPDLPAELTRGGWPDYALDDCTVQRQRDFAEVLNNLALDNGSAVVSGPTRYESVEDVFVALIDAGHHVRVENNRYFANFLSLNLGPASVIAPVWLDTGLPLADGGTLPIPAPHSHHDVFVTGPLVNARLMYYMGTDNGVSFRSVETLRPDWVGERTLYTYDSADDADRVVRLMTLAGRLRKVWTERGQGLPALGYGQLGVCNDSTAVLELEAEGSVSLYPLAQPGVEGAPQDQVDALLAQLPQDLAGPDATALTRIGLTLPYTGAPLPALAGLLEAAAR
ncbi:MAG: hypothetical protein H6702_13895 [Myxococcales bacterium]|nr:hypothetical protein [Myxococcales bacterium]